MSPSNGAAQNRKTWTVPVLEELVEKSIKDMQNLASEGLVHLGQYYAVQGSMLAASYQRSWSDHCYLFKWFCLLSLVSFMLNGVPYLRIAYKYTKAKNTGDTCKLKYAFAQDHGRKHMFREDSLGKMYNYVTLFGGSVLLILATNMIVVTLGRCFLCDRGQEELQKNMVVINNPIIRFNNVGGCLSACDDQNKCWKICSK